MPRWVRWLQPLLSGVFTVDNLDYVRRDAYLTGVAAGPGRCRTPAAVHVHLGPRPDPVRAGPRALEMFLTARRFMYQQVYFHRTVRAIDLDLARGLRAVDPGDLRRRLAGRAAGRLRRPRRVRPAPPGGALGTRRGRGGGRRRVAEPGDGRVTPAVADGVAGDPAAPPDLAGRGGDPRRVRGRRPTRRADRVARRRRSPAGSPSTSPIVDARPADATATDRLLGARGPRRIRRRCRRRCRDPGLLAHRAALPAPLSRAGQDAGGSGSALPSSRRLRAVAGGRASGRSARSGSAGTPSASTTTSRSRSVAVSSGLNRP